MTVNMSAKLWRDPVNLVDLDEDTRCEGPAGQ